MFSGQLYDGIKQLIYFFWVKWITMLILRTVNLSSIVVTSCLVGDLLFWNAVVIILTFSSPEHWNEQKHLAYVHTIQSYEGYNIPPQICLNNIYCISQIPVQHKYSTILSSSMNIMSFIIEKDNICIFALAKVQCAFSGWGLGSNKVSMLTHTCPRKKTEED